MGERKMADHENGAVKNAYSDPQRVRPGCEHRLGCKCDVPFWLRNYTQAENEFEQRMRISPLTPTSGEGVKP